MKTQKIYCAGKFIETNNILEIRNSFDNNLIATTFLASEKELNDAIYNATIVKNELREMPTYKKFEILMHISDGLKNNKEEIAQTLSLEACKPLKFALAEVERSFQTFVIAAEECKRLPKEYISIDWTKAGENKEGFVKYFPVGIVAGIAPFNFPLNLAVHKIAPAIASGCPIILKPSRSTPLSTLKLAEIIDNTDLPKGALSVLPMDRLAGNLLVTEERIALLSFTGSPEVGWKMKSEAGKKRVLLELGGNAGAIVTDSAILDFAVTRCISGAFAYAGQVCIHTQRIYVHENIFNQFVEKFVYQTKKLKSGHPQSPETHISAMIDEHNAIRVENWVDEALKSGATLLTGGKRKGSFFEPTILTNTQRQMKVCCSEVFGPVVIIEKYSKFEDAINLINDSEFGLQAGIFTDKASEINYTFNNLEVGGVIINDVPTFRVDNMPYGGIKNSGFGREGVKYSILEMMEPKLLVKNIY